MLGEVTDTRWVGNVRGAYKAIISRQVGHCWDFKARILYKQIHTNINKPEWRTDVINYIYLQNNVKIHSRNSIKKYFTSLPFKNINNNNIQSRCFNQLIIVLELISLSIGPVWSLQTYIHTVIDLKSDLNVNARMQTEIDLNECEHFPKANWDRSKRVNTFSKWTWINLISSQVGSIYCVNGHIYP